MEKSKGEEKNTSRFVVEVPSANRKAFAKILSGLVTAEVISSYREEEQENKEAHRASTQQQMDQISQYHDLID